MSDDFVITKCHPLAVQYVDGLQRANVEALSFYPKQVFEREIERGRILIAILNGEPCGYIYMGSAADGVMRCHQVCIQYDARRRLYGARLVAAMEEEAVTSSASWIRLRCGFDLAANDFWKSLGYVCVRHVAGGIRRMRTINVWEKVCGPELFGLVGIEPARGTQDSSVWRKHKSTGIVTQFARGKKLEDYRATVLASAETKPSIDATASERSGG
jgi:hypothetical protein